MKDYSAQTKIALHLIKRGHITALEALGVYRCFRLASVIHRLRKQGMNIHTINTKDATGKQYARYYYHSPIID